VRQQVEVGFRHAAIRADPIFWDIFESRAGGNAVLGHADRFVIDPAAGAAHPLPAHASSTPAACSSAWISLRRCLSAGVTIATKTASRKRRWAGWRIR